MSKRHNMQIRRRQIRRALKAAGDSIKSFGMGKINRIGYGCGLSRSEVRGENKQARNAQREEYEMI